MNVREQNPDKHMDSIESIWVEIVMKSQKLIFACIYRPPNQTDFMKHFTPILEKFSHRSNILMMGDFNIDLSKEDLSVSTTFHRTLSKFALQNVIKDYTRITDKSMTLIDLAITSLNHSKILKSGSYACTISDHHLIYITLNLFLVRPPPVIKSVKDYKNIDTDKINFELESAPWHIISIFDDVDDSLWVWEKLFTSIINENVKTRKAKIRNRSEPWMTSIIRKELNNRFRLFQKAKVTPRGSQEWKDYKTSRNRCSNIIKSAKAKYWQNEFKNSKNSKTFWRTVRKFRGDCTQTRIGPLIDDDDKIVTNDNKKADLMNNFFASVGKKLSLALNQPNDEIDLNKHIYRVTPTSTEIKADFKLFQKSFNKAVKLGKACGPDSISARDLKFNESASTYGLYEVLCQITKTHKFPTAWKMARVSCIFKKGSKRDCSNYRPISLLSIPSKVVENFICHHVNTHLENFNLLNEHQWGFRKARSTEDLLLYLTETWQAALDQKKVVGILLIDFKKAFDTVSHPILLKKLSAIGISGNLHKLIADYLSDRSQVTQVNGVTSSKENVEYGVPQGSLLGPVAFSVNINDMPDHGELDTDLFADDSNQFIIGNNVDEVMIKIQNHVNEISIYAKENSLTIHPDKSQILIMSKDKFVGPLPSVSLKGENIRVVEKAKCLGVIVDNNMSWGPHTDSICKMFSKKLKNLYKMNSLHKSTLRTIYNTGILPSILYGILIWGNCAQHLLDDVEKIHIKAARYIERIKKSTPDTEVLSTANWKPLLYYYKKQISCKTYKIYNKLTSPLLSNLIVKSKARRTRNQMKLDQPRFRFVSFKRSFAYRSAIVWNNIPQSTREKESADSFKRALVNSNILNQINFGSNQTGRARDPDNYIYY